MQQKTILDQPLSTTENGENSNSPNQNYGTPYTRENIENTPFWIAGDEEKGYHLIIGNYALSPSLTTKTGVRDFLRTHRWEIILTLCTIVYKSMETDKQTNNIQ